MGSQHIGAFTRDPAPERVVFGPGSVNRLADEVAALGLRRIMLVAAGSSAPVGESIAKQLGAVAVGIFGQVRQHVPEDLAAAALCVERAQERGLGTEVEF